jgi:hypothetical protein
VAGTNKNMPSAVLQKIVLASLGITAVAVFATAAASMYSRAATPARKHVGLSSPTDQKSQAGKPDLPAHRGSPLVPHGGAMPVAVAGPQPRAALPVPARTTAETRGAAEKMFPNGLTKDFGPVPQGTKLLHCFPVSNIHTAPVTIAYLQPSCGCLTATAAQHTLQPGESTTIEIRMDVGHFTGPNTQNVRVKIVGPDFISTCKLVVSAVSQALTPGRELLANPAVPSR